jgi:hypothetical protein
MIHYTYWIVDRLNGMYYHGVHSSEDPADIRAYHGSCRALRRAVRARGIENFEKRIERVHPTREAANEWEAKVHKRLNLAAHPRFYNAVNANPLLSLPGNGLSEKHRERLFSAESKAKMAAAKLGRAFPKDEAWRLKVSAAKKGRPLGAAHAAALRGVRKDLTEERRADLSSRATARAGTGLHARCRNQPGYVVWRLADPRERYYVLNGDAFGAAVAKVKGSASAKFQAIIQGKRNHFGGYAARRPTEEEIADFRPRLLESGDPYVRMGSG